MQAIQTKYLAPTAFSGARVKATSSAASITVPWDDSLDVPGNHRNAARLLCEKLEWTGALASGQLPDGTYAHVFTAR